MKVNKTQLDDAEVYIHLPEDDETGATRIHIDIVSDELRDIVGNGESTFCAGKPDGVLIGLKEGMDDRAREMTNRDD